MLDKIKKDIYNQLQALFAEAAVNEMIGDTSAYKTDLKKIAVIAEALGISPEITFVNINLKSDKVIFDVDSTDGSNSAEGKANLVET